MKKLSELAKKLLDKFKSFGKWVKIAIIVAGITIIIAIISAIVMSTSTKYSVLFSDLDAADSQVIVSKLDDAKVTYKIDGNSILVDSTQVDKLRMEYAPELSTASKGYELMDTGSSFGMTDEEFNIKKIRMIQGELEKGIKSLEQVKNAKVNITPAKDSVFVEDKTEGSAAVVLELKPGQKLSDEQVDGIVAFISASTENIPKKNISVIDTKSNLLTKSIDKDGESGDTGVVGAETIQSNRNLESNYEQELVKKVVALLEPVVGKNKVKAEVNADFDFDSTKSSEYEVDPNKTLISQETTKEYNNANGGTTSASPVDNNMSNTINSDNSKTSSGSEHQVDNYDHSTKKTEKVKAPGEIRRLSVSVFIDGQLDDATRTAFEDAVKAATGFNSERQDQISLAGIDFDPTIAQETQAQIDAYNAQIAAEERNKLILYGVIGLVVVIAIIVLILIFKPKKAPKDKNDKLLDAVIGDEEAAEAAEPVKYDPINFETENESSHIENEIKKYATEKPEQVAEIIKSWLNDNER
jgi:flagellar M-ring protein FliF